jgi:citronellol/citronellal dehydrogenase
MELDGKVAIVTGASRGVGAATALMLAERGCKVVCAARATDAAPVPIPGTIDETVRRIREAGGEAIAVPTNLAKDAEVERMITSTVEQLGPVDILVNNAAITYFMPVTEFPEKRFKLMMEVQVHAPFHLAQLVLPAMREKKQGWIVNISSGAGLHPKLPYTRRGGGTVYGMCKAALERFTTGLASEVYDDGIAVNVVSPGLVDTPGVAVHGLINEATKDRVQPIKFIAEAVYRLATADPKTMTGTINYAEPFLKSIAIEPAELV